MAGAAADRNGAGQRWAARLLAYRLYDICERKDRAADAQVWNMLARERPTVEAAAERVEMGLRKDVLPFREHGGA